ncbi:MAG: response regulator [Symploca sp. SIO2G7]|nr:response regulator [Symploca sp. SIO2G7]
MKSQLPFKYLSVHGCDLTILQGDLLSESVDAIVSPTNNILNSSGLCSSIHHVAGDDLRRETKSIEWLHQTEARITPAFGLRASYVIHACAPVSEPRRSEASGEALAQCYRNCLQIAVDNQLQSIAFPCIGTGMRGFERDWAARITLKSILTHLATQGSPQQVRIVCRSSSDYEAYQRQLQHPVILPLLGLQSPTLPQSNPQRIQAIADQLVGQIAVPYRLGVIGSTSFWNDTSEVICAATGRFLAEFLMARSLKWQNNFALLTGGVSGVAETVARSFQYAWNKEKTPPIFHIQPKGFEPWDFGTNLFGGSTLMERRAVLGAMAPVYLLIEGGPGAEQEARIAQENGAIVIPLGQSGGFAERLYQQINCPSDFPQDLWQILGDDRVSPVEVGEVLATLILKAFERSLPEAQSPTVLVIDDSITVRELLKMSLTKEGYQVVEAKNGWDAWKLLEQGFKCDMILSDIDMPHMDGWELLSRLQADKQFKQIPIAMITSREVSHDWVAVRSGVWQKSGIPIMTKPYSQEVLSEVVGLLSRGKRLI